MKKGFKILIIVTVIILIIILLYISLFAFKKGLCGTPYYLRNPAGQCEIKVGCSIPSGLTEDLTCKEILRQQIDRNKTS